MKRIGSPKNGSAFFAKCRESPVRAFRKKTPISVRRCRGGAKGGTEKVRSFVTFFLGWTPLMNMYAYKQMKRWIIRCCALVIQHQGVIITFTQLLRCLIMCYHVLWCLITRVVKWWRLAWFVIGHSTQRRCRQTYHHPLPTIRYECHPYK